MDACPTCNSGLVQSITGKLCVFKCLACGVEWKAHTRHSCKGCGAPIDPSVRMMRMAKDGRCDWTACDECGLFHNGDDLVTAKHIEMTA